ncbi:MAG: Nif3-like dinuclear metal center hexameric protein [Acidobacteriota bacterium]
MDPISRRNFVVLAASGLVAAPLTLRAVSGRGPVTAQQIVDRIEKQFGAAWKPNSGDTFKAGDPSTVVTGIATTALATLDVLGQAVKAGANLIVTCEPAFYSHADTPAPSVRRRFQRGADGKFVLLPPPPGPPPTDPVFTAKQNFIKKHNLVVWRFSENWRLRTPNPYAQGLAAALGWAKYARAGDPAQVSIPESSLQALALHVKASLHARGGMRIVGHPQLKVRKVAFLPGSTPIQASLETLPEVDTVIAGEVREWESVEYVRDTVDLGGRKALILVGRIVSEEPGMRVCAQWLNTLVPEVKSTSISAGDPYWRPTA